MSEFKCAEPGCDYHVGIGGPVVTDDDFERQDNYFLEIEEHQQMHEKQASYFVEVDPDTAAWLDHHGLMKSHQSKSGRIVPNELHNPAQTIKDVVGLPLTASYKEREFGSVPVELSVMTSHRVSELAQERGIRLDIRIVGAGSDDGVARDVESNDRASELPNGKGNGPFRRLFPPFPNTLHESMSLSRGDVERMVAVDVDVHVQNSLSVDGAPNGAVGGTSESTERGLTPGVPEMKEHPAAATAGCDETKHSNGK